MKKITKKNLITAATMFTSLALVVSGAAAVGTVKAEEPNPLLSFNGAAIAYGPGWNAAAAKEVSDAFDAKINELSGPSHGDVTVALDGSDAGKAVAFEMTYTGGTLMYNVFDKKVYALTGGFAAKAGEVRRIGAPVTDKLTGIKVSGYDGEGAAVDETGATVQIFETGILIEKSGTVEKHEGVVEKVSDTEYKIHPLLQDQDVLAKGGESHKFNIDGASYGFVGNIDGTWHALRTARNYRRGDDFIVEYNFRAGCIEFAYNADYTVKSRVAYAGQNFDYTATGARNGRATVSADCFTSYEHLFEYNDSSSFEIEHGGSYGVSDEALESFKTLSGKADAGRDDLKEAFKGGYLALIEAGVVPGYRCSVAKVWDGMIVVDYKYSPDSDYGFDKIGSGGRERMFTLVYSGAQKKVFGVGGDIWQLWQDNSTHRALGAPISNAMTNKTISGTTFNRIQIFERGYVYENDRGALMIEYGATTDNAYTQFDYKASPTEKPSEYGSEVGRFEATVNGRRVIYINYEKGAVTATENYAKQGYIYDYYPGRKFVEESGKYVAKLHTYDELYNDSDFICEESADTLRIFNGYVDDNGEPVEGAKSQIIKKVKDLLDSGFFVGFLEDKFKSWNHALGQQFIYGDSTADPWTEVRTNVSALIYNNQLGKVFLLKDAFMDVWGGSRHAHTWLGTPASEEFTLAGNDTVKFQYFYGNTTEDNLSFAVSVGYNEAAFYATDSSYTPQDYLDDITELSTPLSGIEIDREWLNETLTYEVGDFEMLDFIMKGAVADVTVTVTSSNSKVAEIQEDNSIEFNSAGKATITVTATDGINTYSDSITFTVVKPGRSAAAGTTDVGAGNNIGGILAIAFSAAALVAGAAVTTVAVRKKKQTV